MIQTDSGRHQERMKKLARNCGKNGEKTFHPLTYKKWKQYQKKKCP
jgi:hypothetical protein